MRFNPGLADAVRPGGVMSGLGISPDVVTLGKPMANGHPVAAVVARAEIMAEFRSAFGYFKHLWWQSSKLRRGLRPLWTSSNRTI